MPMSPPTKTQAQVGVLGMSELNTGRSTLAPDVIAEVEQKSDGGCRAGPDTAVVHRGRSSGRTPCDPAVGRVNTICTASRQ
jgi:hypothetical protein